MPIPSGYIISPSMSSVDVEKHDHGSSDFVSDVDGFNKAAPGGTTGAEEDLADVVLRRHLDEAGAQLSPEDVKRVVRKIDFLMVPLMYGFLIYTLNYTDKNLMAIGANFKLVQDLGLFTIVNGKTQTARYSNATTIYYIGFLCGAPIAAFLAQRYPTAKVCAIAVVCWGLTCTLTALAHDYTGTMIQRTFLGLCEAGVLPCFYLLIGSFYTKREQAFRFALFYAGAGFGNAITIPINYGILNIKGSSIAPWRIAYLFWGTFTFVYGILLFFILPDTPANAWHLNEHEKFVAVERLRGNQNGIGNRHFKKDQAIEAITDPKVILVGLIVFCNNCVNAVSSAFSPIIFRNLLHASPNRVLVLTIPLGCMVGASVIFVGWLSQVIKTGRIFLLLGTQAICLLASILLWVLPQTNQSGLFAGIYLLTLFLSSVILIGGLSTANSSGHTKKMISAAWFTMCIQASAAASPQWFQAKHAPRYTNGFIGIAVTQAASMVMAALYGWLCWRENRRRDAMGDEAKVDRAFMDLTDKQNLSFRYLL